MTIRGRGLFQADDGLGQLACKVVLVELAEHLFQLTGSAGGFDSLFHDFSNLSLDKKGRDKYNIGVARPGGWFRALYSANFGRWTLYGALFR